MSIKKIEICYSGIFRFVDRVDRVDRVDTCDVWLNRNTGTKTSLGFLTEQILSIG